MMKETIEEYNKILGVSDDASVNEVKHAFRLKAKELHPDKNKNSNAHEQFILLTEAYEFIIDLKTNNKKYSKPVISYDDWKRQNREEIKERARQYAKMQYEEFIKTDYYKKTQAAITVIDHLYFLSSMLFILSPLWGFLLKGFIGLFLGLFITFISVHYWADIFREKSKINVKSFLHSIIIIARTKTFLYLIVTIINLILFFNYVLNAQLTFLILSAILLALYGIFYLLFYLKVPIIKSFTKTAIFLCFVPTIFNLFFFANSIFSSNPTIEKYSFVHAESWYGSRFSQSRLEKISYIYLPNEKYSEYPWFRFFIDFDAMKYKSEIIYKFEDGLFGVRVLKSYKFSK